ncbi:estradiol 17-beta-dehydrogenase 2 [Zeugodacus cucurbitae]|uniref:D-beta-hydroxybutyrate dehydrogenase, mitochondrial n=1 Tax=Zeugodacus cucurbitae TaxID=28588 RepID=A0A0A1XQT5_ZEUCU|nr:estradiol 17-beta-dehydrogenase 2 [Zeugodacus cucurbitae]XP_011176969.1 estradiol 17-beta-dehydrogenase 2 [Zeugodacus cucurbitae]XP_028893867.1 estradiol 17-beta-dehydrogenase 2 [Zeugodacus cucurbitae]XP_054086788.1 estradiol 17-beta-dehydrogenase 2 [Zeugodacus cucurbitae]
MEPMTALVLAFQLLALFSIAGALLIYLICKVRDDTAEVAESQPGTVLVTSADTALGLQLCTHLANKGCRVFAGMRDAQDSLPAKLLNGWLKMREYNEEPVRGAIIPMQLDVTREDVLRETTSAMGAHMNAGERGIAAVINTSGSLFRGRVEAQEAQQWEHMLKTNILGSLRVAKAFVGFLRPTRGRLIYLGAGTGAGAEQGSGDGLVAFNASRAAVEKCVDELRKELQPYGVRVVALDTTGITAEALYRAPLPHASTESEGAPTQYTADVLSANALQVIERALWDVVPLERYQLVQNSKLNFMLPCRSSLRMTKLGGAVSRGVQRV